MGLCPRNSKWNSYLPVQRAGLNRYFIENMASRSKSFYLNIPKEFVGDVARDTKSFLPDEIEFIKKVHNYEWLDSILVRQH